MTAATRQTISCAALTGIAVGSVLLAAVAPHPTVPLAACAAAIACCTRVGSPEFARRTWPAIAMAGCTAAALWGGPGDLPCAAWAAILIAAPLTIGASRPRHH